MLEMRVNARLSGQLAGFLNDMVGETGRYETPSEYIRDLIRRDMEKKQAHLEQEVILQGFRDVKAGRVIKGSGNLLKDVKRYRRMKASGKI